MGASAGAGSGEFDIYRGCRRRELIRQEYLTEKSEKVYYFYNLIDLIVKIILNRLLIFKAKDSTGIRRKKITKH